MSGESHTPAAASWWRRRFLRLAIVVALVWVVVGIVFGVLLDGERDGGRRERRGPPGVLPAVVIAAVGATFVAYRRLAGPVSELLGGAERVGTGDYSARVRPAGPRSVRSLGEAFNDMTARLEASEMARRRFIADVTHELRTPLTVLQGGVEAQLDGIHPRDDAHLQRLLEQTRTLDRLVEDLRTLSLGDAGQLHLHRETTSIRTVVDDAVVAIASTAAERDVALSTTGDDVELEVDPVRVRQIVTNLLTNAVRHTPRGGAVTAAVAAGDGRVTVTVTDTGPGLGPHPERAFERFVRSPDSTGSGLGLTIARQLAERHGGTLTATDAPGGGAVLTLALPVRSSD